MKIFRVLLLFAFANEVKGQTASKVVNENNIRWDVQQAYMKCSAGYLSWEDPLCKDLLRLMATVFSKNDKN